MLTPIAWGARMMSVESVRRPVRFWAITLEAAAMTQSATTSAVLSFFKVLVWGYFIFLLLYLRSVVRSVSVVFGWAESGNGYHFPKTRDTNIAFPHPGQRKIN
jgi:hypothetical protein